MPDEIQQFRDFLAGNAEPEVADEVRAKLADQESNLAFVVGRAVAKHIALTGYIPPIPLLSLSWFGVRILTFWGIWFLISVMTVSAPIGYAGPSWLETVVNLAALFVLVGSLDRIYEVSRKRKWRVITRSSFKGAMLGCAVYSWVGIVVLLPFTWLARLIFAVEPFLVSFLIGQAGVWLWYLFSLYLWFGDDLELFEETEPVYASLSAVGTGHLCWWWLMDSVCMFGPFWVMMFLAPMILAGAGHFVVLILCPAIGSSVMAFQEAWTIRNRPSVSWDLGAMLAGTTTGMSLVVVASAVETIAFGPRMSVEEFVYLSITACVLGACIGYHGLVCIRFSSQDVKQVAFSFKKCAWIAGRSVLCLGPITGLLTWFLENPTGAGLGVLILGILPLENREWRSVFGVQSPHGSVWSQLIFTFFFGYEARILLKSLRLSWS